MHPSAAPDLALHNHLLSRVHPDGLPLRGARRRHEDDHLQLPDPPGEHVELRHPECGTLHLPVSAGSRPSGWPAEEGEVIQGSHRAPEDGDRTGDRCAGDGVSRDSGVLPAQVRSEVVHPVRGVELAEHLLAGPAVRLHRGIRGVHVRGAARVLQRAGAGRAQELRECALHDLDLARELRQQPPRDDGDEDIDRGPHAWVDTGEPQQGPPRQILLPPRCSHDSGSGGVYSLCEVVQMY